MTSSPAQHSAGLPIRELLAGYRRRELSPVDVVEECLQRIGSTNPVLNAYLTVTEDLARRDAQSSQARFNAGLQPRPLEGIPVAVKDVFTVQGYPTTFGSRAHRHDPPRPDSGAVRRLRAAGATIVGKTNTAEFGQSATTENLLGPPTTNPWDPKRTAGGSSGGSAAAVGAGTAVFGLGADGGGSLRIPAAFTGLVGLKPTPGLCADEGGLVAMSPFSSPGPLARCVADARAVLEVLAERPFPRRGRAPGAVGYLPAWEPIDAGVTELVAGAAATTAELGYEVLETTVDTSGWRELFATLVLAEEWRERGPLLTQCPQELTEYERRTLEAGAGLSDADVQDAAEQLKGFRRRIDAALSRFDVVLAPTTAVPAFPVEQRPDHIADQPVDRLWGAFPFTAPWNVAGCAAISIPCGFSHGLPVGVQLVSRAGSEDSVLDLAEELEEALAVDTLAVLSRWAGET